MSRNSPKIQENLSWMIFFLEKNSQKIEIQAKIAKKLSHVTNKIATKKPRF